MPRQRNAIPSYRFHKPSGNAYADYTDPITGHRLFAWVNGSLLNHGKNMLDPVPNWLPAGPQVVPTRL